MSVAQIFIDLCETVRKLYEMWSVPTSANVREPPTDTGHAENQQG